MSARATHWANRETGEIVCDRYPCLPFSERWENLGVRKRWQGLVLGQPWRSLTCARCGEKVTADGSRDA